MEEIIYSKLKEIEEKEQVKIIYAIESGSRAWGFASPDSDYDVRFIYVRRAEEYLKINRPRDVIEWQLDDVLDINGWDIQKALHLLRKSNPTLFEWANSPIVYKKTKEWEMVLPIINSNFIQKPSMYHYLNMASSNYREYLKGEEVRIKKYLYVLRPLLACKWILANQTPPPMAFMQLLETQLDAELRPLVMQLLERKSQCNESELMPRVDAINTYIEETFAYMEEEINLLKKEAVTGYEELEKLFLQVLEYAY